MIFCCISKQNPATPIAVQPEKHLTQLGTLPAATLSADAGPPLWSPSLQALPILGVVSVAKKHHWPADCSQLLVSNLGGGRVVP